MYIKGEIRPIINNIYKYTLDSFFSGNTGIVVNKPIAIDNTRVVRKDNVILNKNFPSKKFEKKDEILWKIYLGAKFVTSSKLGEFTFVNGNQTYTLQAIVQNKIVATATIKTLGGKPSINLYWLDEYRQKINNRTVGYLDKIYLIIKTSHIPVGDTLDVTIYEDEYEDGHSSKSRNMGTTKTTPVNKNGYARVYFTNMQAFRKVLNEADYYDESEHEFYAKVYYDSHISKIYDKIQLKVKNEKVKLIEPPLTNMPVVVGEVDIDVSDKKIIKNLTIGVFIDGTMNNRYDTIARTDWEKKRAGENSTSYSNSEHLKIYATKKTDVVKTANYKYGQVSYENDLSNPAILFDNYKKDDKNVFKIYTEGMGTNTLGDKDGIVKKYEEDDSLGAAVAWGTSGIVERVHRAVQQMADKISVDKGGKEKIGTITVDVFGFSRGAASARHFVHEITKPAYKAKPGTGREPIPYSTRDISTPVAVDDNGYSVDVKYRKLLMPTNGRLGYLLTQKGITIDKLIIRFAGLYDTVAHHGVIQGNDIDDLGLNTISSKAQHIVHITAGDEHRYNFSLSRIPRKKNHIELNFPGVHCDVGGSYVEGRPEGTAHGVRIQDIEETHVLREDSVTTVTGQTNYSINLETFRKKLIEEGWFTEDQIKISKRLSSAGKATETYKYSLVTERPYVSNQYSYIPLHMMLKFAMDKKLDFDKGALIKSKNFTPNIFPDHMELMQTIKKNLEEYANKVIANPTASLEYLIASPDLKRLRNNYLHYNATATFVNKPEKDRIRDIVKPSK